jgi:hypothetical protein
MRVDALADLPVGLDGLVTRLLQREFIGTAKDDTLWPSVYAPIYEIGLHTRLGDVNAQASCLGVMIIGDALTGRSEIGDGLVGEFETMFGHICCYAVARLNVPSVNNEPVDFDGLMTNLLK